MPFISNDKPKVNKSSLNERKPISFEITSPKYKMSDLILSDELSDELFTIVKSQINWNKIFVEWNLQSVMKQRKNIFVNLYGDPGTGKTMAAHAIASELKKNLVCVNYSDIESKYVGETSKNLCDLFNYCQENDVIIFFDEADAMLSKRVTNMSSSTDVSVNQTRSVLLTLLNDYQGMVIFATNFLSNYDSAFMRRIQYHVKFELPNAELRKKLWDMYIPDELPADINIDYISDKYDGISGSDISNAILRAALKSAGRNENCVPQVYFEESIQSIIESKKINQNNDVSIKRKMVSEKDVPEDILNKSINERMS